MKNTGPCLFAFLVIVFGQNLSAQPERSKEENQSYQAIEKLVLENNRSIKAARELMDVSILNARTGNTPPDPEIEIGYMQGNQTGMETRMDFSVSQKFDFPSSYIHLSRLKHERTVLAEISYKVIRQEILLETKKQWIMALFLNVKEELLFQRLENVIRLQDHFRQKLEAGEVGALEWSQANLQMISLQADYEEVLLHKAQNQMALDEMCGGSAPLISILELPLIRIPSADSLFKAYELGPEMQYYLQELEIRERKRHLAASQHLPKLSAGYYSETVVNQQFKGVQIGVSVPLWENSNKLKLAKSEILFAHADTDRFAHIQKKEIGQKLERCTSLENQMISMEKALSLVNDLELLTSSLENGEISLAEYLYSSELYFQNLLKLQILKRDRLLVGAELMKVYF